MYKKKIAIYVEGQTEQVLINFLISVWWNYTGIKIQNIKLRSYQATVCKIKNFSPDVEDESCILFLIIDVDGVGSLTSAIANRANGQKESGFEIIGLRDLSAQDFNDLPSNIDRIGMILETFKKALKIGGCKNAEEIELYFAVMTIESWLLAFTAAVSKWAKISEENILQYVNNENFEEIKAPSNVLKRIGGTRGKDPKSYGEVVSIVSKITNAEIEKVYRNKKVPNFNKFWDKLISLCECI